MASKLNKVRRRGRPCKENVGRTDTGRISRAANQDEAPDKLMKEYRMRHYNVSREDAAQPAAGSVIGRLCLSGEISKDQLDALTRYDAARIRNLSAIGAPDSLKTRNGGVMYHPDDEDDVKAARKWRDMSKAIMDLQCQHPASNFHSALSFMVARDEFHPHMLGDLRLVANCLCRHFGVATERKSG